MKKTVLIIISIIICSCNSGTNRKSDYGNPDMNLLPYLRQGEHEIVVDGVKLWYLVRGKGPVLIVYPSSAGWGGDCSVYVENLKPWEENRTVIYIEPRGCGKSERLDSMSDYSMDKYVEELEKFREKLKIEKFDLYGHCYAGMISMKYALKYQHHLGRLIVMSTWPKLMGNWNEWIATRDGFKNMMNRFEEIEKEKLNDEEKFKQSWKNTFTVTFHDYSKHKEQFERIMDKTIFSSLPQQQFSAIEHLKYNIVDSLSNINTKTLIIFGDDDFPMAITGSKLMNSKLPNAKMIEVKNSSHWAFIEQPDIFFNKTIKFLND